MSIHGIGNTGVPRPATPPPLRDGRTRAQQPATPGALQTPATLPPRKPGAASASHNVPATPPPGTDPALWSVLSGEERAFFAKAGAMGPLTYGRALRENAAVQNPASRGGRLDVKI